MSTRRRTAGLWLAAAVAGAMFMLVIAGGRKFLQRMDEVERRMSALTSRVDEVARRAEAAAGQASEAGRDARLAAEGRLRAEEAKTEAEQVRTRAEDRARDAQQKMEVAQAEVERVRKEREEELNRMQQALNRIIETRRTALGLVMNLPEKALGFDFDSAELRPESRELLSRIAGILMASDGYGLAIFGHTDDVGTAGYNQQLSERRAESVKRYLVEVGLDPGIISTRGYGKSSPVAKGTGDVDRARNRRVEIALTDTSIQYSGPPLPQTN
jgi:outer membrane protein OmpA-like peptidoglycan-associated protein